MMPSRRRHRWRRSPLSVLAAVTLLATTACARPGPGALEISGRAVALDIAFANKELTKPIDPEVIINLIPAPTGVVAGTQPLADFVTIPEQPDKPDANPPSSRPPASPAPCPTAPSGASVSEPATIGIKRPPAAGTYKRHNEGTIRIVSAPLFDLRFPYPFSTRDELSAAREIAPPPPVDPGAVVGSGPPPSSPGSGVFEWDVRSVVTPDFVVTNTYRLTTNALRLVRRETKSGGATDVFTPQPTIEVLRLNEGEGTTWRSSGADANTRTGMSVEGKIESRTAVDLCGQLVDAFRVTTAETFLDVETGEVTRSDEPTVTFYATHLGGLIVRTEQHVTQQLRDPKTGTPFTVEYDVVSTLDSASPS